MCARENGYALLIQGCVGLVVRRKVVDGVDAFSFAFVSGLSIDLFSSSNPPTSLPIPSPPLPSPPLNDNDNHQTPPIHQTHKASSPAA